MMLDFTTLPTGVNIVLLLAGGSVVWASGTKLAHLADAISERTGLSQVLAGALLLGVATSLPEIATTFTACWIGNATLAVNNLFGSIVIQVALLGVIDIWLVRNGPLTFFSPDPVLLMGGVLLILQIALAIVAIATGDIAIFAHVGLWPILLAVVYLISLYLMNRYSYRNAWLPGHLPPQPVERETSAALTHDGVQQTAARLSVVFAFNSIGVLGGGWLVSVTCDALSLQTGIGSGFLGATLLALTTSLPEISTTVGAIRLGAYTMAISNIFGTNSLDVALLFPSDLTFREGPVVNAIGDSVILMAGTGIVVTALYLWGLLERRNTTVLRMGLDSFWVLMAYFISTGILYFMTS